MADFRPSDVPLDLDAIVSVMGRLELDGAAALLCLASAHFGNDWQPVPIEVVTRALTHLVLHRRNAELFDGLHPIHRYDLPALEADGFAARSYPAGPRRVWWSFTHAGLERLARIVPPPASHAPAASSARAVALGAGCAACEAPDTLVLETARPPLTRCSRCGASWPGNGAFEHGARVEQAKETAEQLTRLRTAQRKPEFKVSRYQQPGGRRKRHS